VLVKDEIGREMAGQFGLRFRLPRNSQGSFTCRKSATWYRRKVCCGFLLCSPKIIQLLYTVHIQTHKTQQSHRTTDIPQERSLDWTVRNSCERSRSIETCQSGRHTLLPCRETKTRGYIKRNTVVGRTDYERRKYIYLKVSDGKASFAEDSWICYKSKVPSHQQLFDRVIYWKLWPCG
jgi:hypothetical protein